MPLYEYKPVSKSCPYCSAGFEMLQSMEEPPIEVCPRCGNPCTRVFSAFSQGKSNRSVMSHQNLERHGFTEYTKTGDGSYERSAGTKGPKTLGKKGSS